MTERELPIERTTRERQDDDGPAGVESTGVKPAGAGPEAGGREAGGRGAGGRGAEVRDTSSPNPQAPGVKDAPHSTNSSPAKSGRRRKLLRLSLWLLALSVGARIILALAFPWVISLAGLWLDMEIRYDNVSISVFEGDAEIWKLEARPRGDDAHEAMAIELNYARVDLAIWRLITGDIHFSRAVIDGLDLHLTRAKSMEILAEGNVEGFDSLFDVSIPFSTEELRVRNVRVHFEDDAVTPPVDLHLTFDMHLDKLGSRTVETQIKIVSTSPGLYGQIHIDGKGTIAGSELDFTGHFELDDLMPEALSGYLHPLGIDARNAVLDVDGDVSIQAKLADRASRSWSTNFALQNLTLTDLASNVHSVERFELVDGRVGPGIVRFRKLNLSGVRTEIVIDADNHLHIAGISTEKAFIPSRLESMAGTAVQLNDSLEWELTETNIDDVSITLRDLGVEPQVECKFKCDRIRLGKVGHPWATRELPLQISLQIPKIAETVTIDGLLEQEKESMSLDMSFEARGITLEALRARLARVGCEPNYGTGGTTAGKTRLLWHPNSDGDILLDADMSFSIAGETAPLASVERLTVKDLAWPPNISDIRAGEIEFAGTHLDVSRIADGRLEILGLRVNPAHQMAQAMEAMAKEAMAKEALAKEALATEPDAHPATLRASATPPSVTLPSFEFRSLRWKDADLHFRDFTSDPPTELHLRDIGCEFRNFLFEHDVDGRRIARGDIEAWLKLQGMVEELRFDASLIEKESGPRLEFQISGHGLQSIRLAPYLKQLGLESSIEDSTFDMKGEMSIRDEPELALSLSVRNMNFKQGNRSWFEVEAVDLLGWRLRSDILQADSLQIRGPSVWLRRDDEGSFRALGLRVSRQTLNEWLLREESEGFETRPALTASSLAIQPYPIRVDSLVVEDASVHWLDTFLATPIEATLKASLRTGVHTRSTRPIPFDWNFEILETGTASSSKGEYVLHPDRQYLKCDLSGKKFDGHLLDSYLPSGTSSHLEDSHLSARIDAELLSFPEGIKRCRIVLEDVEIGDKNSRPLSFDSFKMIVPSIDPRNQRIDIDEISIKGLRLEASRTSSGQYRMLGLDVQPSAIEHALKYARDQKSSATSRLRQRLSRMTQIPELNLQRLDLELSRAEILFSREDGTLPLVAESVNLRNRGAIRIFGEEVWTHPPFVLDIAGKLSPLAESVTIEIEARPLAKLPELAFKFEARGLRGAGISEVFPALGPHIEGASLQQGLARVHGDAVFDIPRRGPHLFDFSEGFSATLNIADAELLETPDGPRLASVDEIVARVEKIVPSSGELQMSSLMIRRPWLEIRLQDEGLLAFGVHFRHDLLGTKTALNPMDTEAPAHLEPRVIPVREGHESPAEHLGKNRQSVTVADTEVAGTGIPATAIPTADLPRRAVQIIRELQIENGQFLAVDETTEPICEIPIRDFDFELRGLTSACFEEPSPLEFYLFMNSGEVALPQRATRSFLGGIASTAGKMIGASDQSVELEKRNLFQEIVASGKFDVYLASGQPHASSLSESGTAIEASPVEVYLSSGKATASAEVVELVGFRGPAEKSGITIHEGLADMKLSLTFQDDGQIKAKTLTILNQLAISEPPDGPLRRTLKLAAPLGTVLFILRDENQAIQLPVDFRADAGSTRAEMAAIFRKTLGTLIGNAVANSPFRVAGTIGELGSAVGSIFGMNSETAEVTSRSVSIEFDAGNSSLSSTSRQSIRELAADMLKSANTSLRISHGMGSGDLEIGKRLANPSREDSEQVIERLKRYRQGLKETRRLSASRARAAFRSGLEEKGEAQAETVRRADQELAKAESSLDALYTYIHLYSHRGAPRRTRLVCLNMAAARIQAVRDAFAAAGITMRDDHVRRPRFTQLSGVKKGRVTLEFSGN